MKKAHKSNWRCGHHADDDFEEWEARDGHWYQDKPGECEFSGAGRSPEDRSGQREWYMMSEEDYEGMAGSYMPTYSQVLQGRSNRTKTVMTCPPIIVSDDNHHRFPWEDKPIVAMKITKRRRCKRSKSAPKDVPAPSLFSTKKEVTADSSLGQDGRRCQERRTKIWTSGVHQREEDASEAAETKHTTVTEGGPNDAWESEVQAQEAGENSKDAKDHGDSGTREQLEDKNQEVILKHNISDGGLQEAQRRQGIHQLGKGRNTLQVKKTDSESGVGQQTGDRQQLSRTSDASQKKVQQLEEHTDEVSSRITIHEMLVILLDKKTEGTEEKQSFLAKHGDLLQQIESISDKEEKMKMQLRQLQQQEGQLEDICEGLKKKRKKLFPSIFFSKASKTEKETMAETEAETEVTRGEAKKKRRKWFPLIFFGKASKIEKEAMADSEMSEGGVKRDVR